MTGTIAEQAIQADAVDYAKANRKAIARRLTDPAIYPPVCNGARVNFCLNR